MFLSTWLVLNVARTFQMLTTISQLALLNGASIPGRILPAALTPKLGVFNVVVSSMTACSILIFAMLRIESTSGVAIFAALYGFFSGTSKSGLTFVRALPDESQLYRS